MRRVRDIDLMQLADGELDEAERAEVEAALAADPDARRRATDRMAAIDELGEVVRGDLELAADEAEPKLGRMWAEIEKRIVLDEEAAKPPVPAKVERPGLWARVGRWFEVHRGHVLTGALSAGAVATIVLVFRPTPKVSAPTPTRDAPPSVLNVAAPEPVELESVETPDGTSAVFTYETEDGEETTVIWVTPDDTTEGL